MSALDLKRTFMRSNAEIWKYEDDNKKGLKSGMSNWPNSMSWFVNDS